MATSTPSYLSRRDVIKFGNGCFSGVCGAAAVYGLDLATTRVQVAQMGLSKLKWPTTGEFFTHSQWGGTRRNRQAKSGAQASRPRANVLQFMKEVFVLEGGVIGLYRGFGAVAVGTAPEKGLKLWSNAKMREILGVGNGPAMSLPWYKEAFAGAFAGLCQTTITQPLEMVKQHGQLQGRGTTHKYKGWSSSMRQLGARGLYNNVASTMLRDIPFTAVFFGISHKLKEYVCVCKAKATALDPHPLTLKEAESELHFLTRLFCSTFAGVWAAAIATPADFLKTRLQADYLLGTKEYNGLLDGARKIHAKEGIRAFKTGMVPRIMTRAPMFGITLTIFEVLDQFVKKHNYWY